MPIKNDKLEKLVSDSDNILVVSSHQFDLDSLTSGLLMKKYLQSVDKKVTYVYPKKLDQDQIDFCDYLPFYNEIIQEDSTGYLENDKFDLIILLDGNTWDQFFYISENDPIPEIKDHNKLVQIDHHIKQMDVEVGLAIKDKECSSTVEVLLKYVIPEESISKDMATLAYAGIATDTGNFRWGFNKDTMNYAGLLLSKGAETELTINNMFSTKTKGYIDALHYVTGCLEYDEELGTVFLFLPYEKLEKDDYLSPDKFRLIHDAFVAEVSRDIIGYPRGIIVSEYKGKGVIKVSSRGNNCHNKISLPELYKSIGGPGYGHFHVSGMIYKGDFEEFKKILKGAIRSFLEKN